MIKPWMTKISGGIDAYTKALYHFENDALDSSGNGHNLTTNGITYETGISGFFGTYCAKFVAGSLSRASVNDHADFDISGGIWTFDTAIKFDALAASNCLWGQATNANDYIILSVDAAGKLSLSIHAGGVEVIAGLETGNGAITTGVKYHIEVGENGDNWYLFIDGVLIVSIADASRPGNYTSVMTIGAFYNGTVYGSYTTCHMDEPRLSVGICRHTADFVPPSAPYY